MIVIGSNKYAAPLHASSKTTVRRSNSHRTEATSEIPIIMSWLNCSKYDTGCPNQFVVSNIMVVTVENPINPPTIVVYTDRTPTALLRHQKMTTLHNTRRPTTAATASGLDQFGNNVSITDIIGSRLYHICCYAI